MKVAVVSFRMEPDTGGGAPWSAWLIGHGLHDLGLDVFAITTHDGPDDVVTRNGLRMYRLHPRNLYWVGNQHRKAPVLKAAWQLWDTWNPLMFSAVRRILEQERPEVVHVQKLRGLSPAVWQAAHSAGVETVIQTCRDYELFSLDATLSGLAGRLGQRNSAINKPYQKLRSRFSTGIQAAIAPSMYTLKLLMDRGFFPNAIARVIPNSHGYTVSAVEQRRAEPPVSPKNRPACRVLYLGRLEQSKGVADVCTVVEALYSQGLSIALDVAGDGGQEWALRNRFDACGAITFHGRVLGSRKESLLENSTVVVILSRWPEVFGNVIVEAFAFGKPVIGTRAGGIPEIISQDQTGWLIDGGDLNALRSLLAIIARNPDRTEAMRDDCFQASLSYTTDRLMAAHLALYEELVG